LFIEYQGNTFIQKRTQKDVWQNLWEFPLIESNHLLTDKELIDNQFSNSLFENVKNINISKISNPMKHVLSHRVIYAQFITMSLAELPAGLSNLKQIPISELDNFAVSRLMEIFLETLTK
jgi:A/G-specific adenine glycosylase